MAHVQHRVDSDSVEQWQGAVYRRSQQGIPDVDAHLLRLCDDLVEQFNDNPGLKLRTLDLQQIRMHPGHLPNVLSSAEEREGHQAQRDNLIGRRVEDVVVHHAP